jgi:hypothetical protein
MLPPPSSSPAMQGRKEEGDVLCAFVVNFFVPFAFFAAK